MSTRFPARNVAGDQILRGTQVGGEDIQHILIADAQGNLVGSEVVGSSRGVIVADGGGSLTVDAPMSAPVATKEVVSRNRTGVYLGNTGAHTVLAAAHGALAGFWYLVNPVASGILLALRRIEFASQMGSVLAAPTSPRLTLKKFTTTTNPTAAPTPPVKVKTSMANSVGVLVTAATSMTMTVLGGQIFSFFPTASATAVGYAPPGASDWNPAEEGMPVLEPGERFLFQQSDAGTASDTRRFVSNLAWEEYTA